MDQSFWENRYHAGETGWDRGQASPLLQLWLDIRPQPGTILVPGCGRGHEVPLLVQAGFQVTALDIAAPALKDLRQTLEKERLQADLVQTDVLQWNPRQPQDYVFEQTCLCALDLSHRKAYAEKLRNWLRPTGQLVVGFVQSPGSENLPFNCPESEMRELFGAEAWNWSPLLGEVAHPRGFQELVFVLTKRK